MTQYIGLAGRARSGKTTVLNHLIMHHGFMGVEFSDALYLEVANAFEVTTCFLRNPAIKEAPHFNLTAARCRSPQFQQMLRKEFGNAELSPRVVLQKWGTEYRRATDDDYWIKRTAEKIDQAIELLAPYKLPGIVISGCRFPNEIAFVRSRSGWMWHMERAAAPAVALHSSETPAPVAPGDLVLINNGSLSELQCQVDAALKGINHAKVA